MPVVYNEGLFIGYRWFDAKNIAPLFEFGYGLSYTNFTYSNLGIQQQGQSITITASITNSGKVAGAEVPQLYIGFPQSVQEPQKMLRGFDKIMLKPGQTSTVSFGLNTSKELSVWDTPSRSWKVVSGQFNVYVGASSRDIRLYGTFQN
jgi:beta-glucosidase